MLKFKGRDIVDINNFSKEELVYILKASKRFESRSAPDLLNGKIAALLFFEPSTRTEQSFNSAAQRVGMGVIGFHDTGKTSMAKGESYFDTLRIMEGYSDVIIIRHPQAGAVQEAADLLEVPVVNAGDGSNQHPTQAILDLYTIWRSKGQIDGGTVAFMGDLKYGRTVHALSSALSHFKVKQIFISHPSLKLPQEGLDLLIERKVNFEEYDSLPKDLSADFLYQTRIQKERFTDLKIYKKIKDQFILGKESIGLLNRGVRLMHPLPRVNEIDPILDSHKNALYFIQARNGLYVRQALLSLILGKR